MACRIAVSQTCVLAGFFSGEGRLCARGLPSRHLLGDRDYNL